jgi:MFS transporter, ACS family, aldohexuronate transporter
MSQRNRWYICAFVFLATVLNYMDRQTLGIVAPLIEKEFHLDNAQLGLLFSAFYFSYGISVALIGEVIDRVSIRIGFAVVVAWWSVATGLTALSRTFWQLFGFRMLLGIGEAGNWPATARLVSMYLPKNERTLANSIYMGGGSFGLVIVQPLLVWLSLWYGWRVGFVIIAVFSLFWIAGWLAWFRPANVAALKRQDLAAEQGAAASWREVLQVPRFYGLLVASFFGNACLYFLMNWLPTFLVQDRHFQFNMVLGGVVIIPFLGLDLGYVVSGFTVLALTKRKMGVVSARKLVLIASTALMASSMVFTPLVSSNTVSLLLLFGSTLGMAGWNSNYLCFVEELSPQKVSAVAGVIGSAGAFAGAISLWVIGIISVAAGSFTPVFMLVAAMIATGSAGILLTHEPDREPVKGAMIPATAE